MIEAFEYISHASYFWQSMFMTTACSIFLGAFLYNGDFKLFSKGLLTLIPYILLLLSTTLLRINGLPVITNIHQAYAGLTTIISLSIFYIMGLLIGVCVTRLAHKKSNNDYDKHHRFY